MSLTTRSKAILSGAAASLGLLALIASPSLADNHNRGPRTPQGSMMQMTPAQMRDMHTQMQRMMSRCNAMMSIDTPLPEGERILGSTSALTLVQLPELTQRRVSPQAFYSFAEASFSVPRRTVET